MQRPELVIFDCDGVLIDSESISARMLVAELATRGVDIDLAYVARHFLGRSYPVVMAQIRKQFGLDLPDSFEAEYRARLLSAFETELRVMPGVEAVIAELGIPYCLATGSSPPRVARSLEIVGLAEVFGDRVFTTAEVAHGKPAPDLFFHVADRMGADPARCLVIEDSLNGVRAALAAGMGVWRFTGGSHLRGADLTPPEDAQPHLSFDSFARFYDLAPTLRKTGEGRD